MKRTWTKGKNDAADAPAPPKAPRREHVAVLERNLEKYPWARLSDDSGDQHQLELLLTAAGREGQAWTVAAADGERLPGPLDADIYVALGALYNAQIPRERRGEERRIHTTLGELADIMRRGRGGKTYEGIRAALRRLRHTTVHAVRTFDEGEFRAEEREFSIIGELTWRYRRDGDKAKTVVEIEFPQTIADSIARGFFRLLNVSDYFALETPTARRLYRFLDARRWAGTERRAVVQIPLRQLAEQLPIDRTAPSHIKRTLDPAHEQLVARGFLAAVHYVEEEVPGKKRGQLSVHYTYAPDAPEAPMLVSTDRPRVRVNAGPAPARDSREDPDLLRDLVAEILGTLRDDHSIGFYTKCAKAFDPGVLRFLLAGVRQLMRDDGLSIEAARKTFVANAKRHARETGVKL